jgi:hypothetical protein
MTFKPLTDIHGEELSMSSVVDFHVRTLVRQEKVMDLMEKDQECGNIWRGWLAKFDPDSCSWKTPQCSLLEEEPESLQTLPRWGMTVDGLLWEQQTLEPITRGTECGSWPTPTAHMAKETNAPSEHNRNTPTLTAQVNWPTPRTAGMCGGTGSWELLNKNTTIEEARLMGAGNGGKLNPTWVEWLMGWPLGWTDLNPLATDKSPSVPQKPSDC